MGAERTSDYPPLPPGAISHSMMASWERCPRQFYSTYIAKLPGVRGGAALAGSSIHLAAAVSEDHGWWMDKDRAVDFMLDRARKDFHAEVMGAGGPENFEWSGAKVLNPDWKKGDPPGERKLREDFMWWSRFGLKKMLTKQLEIRRTLHGMGARPHQIKALPVGAEVVLATLLRIPTSDGSQREPVLIRGILDLFLMTLDDEPVIVDWKSGRYLDPHPWQHATYAWLAKESLGVTVNLGITAWLRGAKIETMIRTHSLAEWTPLVPDHYAANVLAIEHEREMLDEYGLSVAFQPRPNMMCGSCWQRHNCPVGQLVSAEEEE